jgi:hypothetical protein
MTPGEKNSLAQMESHELLARIIPRGASKTVAFHVQRHPDLVRKWQRDPDTEDGASNPLDWVKHLMESLLIVNPLNVAWVPQWVENTYRELIKVHHAEGFQSSEARRESAAELLQKMIEVVNAMNVDGCTDHTLELFMQLRSLMDAKAEQVSATLAQDQRMGPRAVANNGRAS